jgi:hypothetical protein
LKNMQVKQKVQMVSGSWIQNVCMWKMKFFMFSFPQPLSSNS